MAFHEDDFHYPMRESPLHSREQSGVSLHQRDRYAASRFTVTRPTTRDSSRARYGAPDGAESPRQLVHPQHSHNVDSPLKKDFLPTGSSFSIESTGFHPGFPGPDSTWTVDSAATSSLDVSENSKQHSKELSQSAPPRPGPPGGPPPDGGLTAWLQVLGGYFLFFNTWGLINAFGVFQTYYKETLIPEKSNSTIAWIGTLTSFLLCASPISWGPIFDTGSPRLLVLFGSFSVVFGIMMTSLCTQYWQLMLAQGICCGIGGGALFITATSVLPPYFSKKRALAMGLSASGSSLGGIIYPIIFTYTLPSLGFGWSVRIIGFIALLTLAVPCLVIKPRSKPAARRKLLDTTILREIPFGFMNIATFFGFVGQYIPYFFIEQFAQSHSLPRNLQFWMLIFLNIGSIPGRIIPSLIADKLFHPLLVLSTTTLGATILAFSWIGIHSSTSGLIVWCLLYGFCSGAFVSLQGAVVASMTSDFRTIGTRFGINMFCGAGGILIGSPVGGAIFPKSWPGAQVFCGGTLGLATAAIVLTYIAYNREQRRKVVKGPA